ncbi:MAG: hypothetical protein A2Y06_02200 [Omnitrophica WOR_2 bacterium GWA2_37_7]|nr:MAG: hypothetical protein A2Y06_02200 [Omnitrophica WOR_2 bacterium GWA2_37_7]OGX53641.1 MAG: hypothetical protein A2267_10230 [Omnitrophica WOR_2 bacterium RIFOXYA12_FULL_38_10]
MRLIINNKAVTLMELIVVVVLIGLIAAFTIPDYKKSLQRSDEKEAINNLAMVWEAMKIYRVKTGDFVTQDLAGVADINQLLKINIIESNMDYSCTYNGGASLLVCDADSPDGWGLRFHTSSGVFSGVDRGVIFCYGGSCPTCQATGC